MSFPTLGVHMNKGLILNMLQMINWRTTRITITSNSIEYEVSWYKAEDGQSVLNVYVDGREIIDPTSAMGIGKAVPLAKWSVEALKN
jgi:hypothetical protein